MDAEHSHTAWCAELAINFMKENAKFGRPWMFLVNIFDPHHPFNPSREYLDRYLTNLKDIPLPAYQPGQLNNKPHYRQLQHEEVGQRDLLAYSGMADRDHRLLRAAYWSMVGLIDTQVGRMLMALEQSGQHDQTLVIFTSDHGEMLGDHGMYLKGPFFYDPCIRMPLIISFPGTVLSGRRISNFAEFTDLAPTLLDAAGLPRYPGMQGKSLWSLLTSGKADFGHRRDVYYELYRAQVGDYIKLTLATMLRTEGYELAVLNGEETSELYDLWRDPGEVHNRWNDPNYHTAKHEMLLRLCYRMASNVGPLPHRIARW